MKSAIKLNEGQLRKFITESIKKVLTERTETEIDLSAKESGSRISGDEIIKYIVEHISDESNLSPINDGQANFILEKDFDSLFVRCEGQVYCHENLSKGDGYYVPDYSELKVDGVKCAVLELYTEGECLGKWDVTEILSDKLSLRQQFKALRESVLKSLVSEAILSVLSEEGIHIKEKNKGKFNATKERTGKSTEELTHSKNPITKKRAIFAQNAKKWNKK